MKKKLLLVLCACMLLSGCGSSISGNAGNGNEVTQQSSGEIKQLGAGSGKEIIPVELADEWQKASYFVDQVYDKEKKNTLVSPLSLDIALGLAYEGASGTTREELQKYLGRADYGDYVKEYMDFAESLETKKSDDGYSFAYELANSIWVRKDSKLKKEYQETVEKKYRAAAENVDFAGAPEKVAKKINGWCAEKTHDMIKEMVKPEMFTKGLEAILMNSVYFESPWEEEWGLTEHEFTKLNGEKVKQEMLRDTVEAYYENDFATGFAKDYYNGFKFIGILPKQEGDFALSDLDLKSLMESRTVEYEVHAIAPKLDYDTTADNIIDILKAQGVTQAFDSYNGQFDNLVEDQELFISDILQKCKIEMDEKGTRAAAVTAIFMEKCAAYVEPEVKEVKEVYLDRAFAFLIYDSWNDKVVFAGKVVE